MNIHYKGYNTYNLGLVLLNISLIFILQLLLCLLPPIFSSFFVILMTPNVSSSDSGLMKRRGSFLSCRCQPLWCRGRDSMGRSLIAMAKKGIFQQEYLKMRQKAGLKIKYVPSASDSLHSHTKFILTRFDPQKFFCTAYIIAMALFFFNFFSQRPSFRLGQHAL